MSDLTTILLIETATSSCSVALVENGHILAHTGRNEQNIHASQLTVFIEEAMRLSGKLFSDLNAVAVSSGPGSYTGLRIGVSTAKGLCYALDIPLIAVDTLKAMARGFENLHPSDSPRLLIPMIDARRMEVYTAIYDQQFETLEAVNAKIVGLQSFDAFSDHQMAIFGDGALKFAEQFSTFPNMQILAYENTAASLATEAECKFRTGDFENVAYFEPLYLKDFVATTPRTLS